MSLAVFQAPAVGSERGRRLRIGLINNMPFSAVSAAEQQFRAAFEIHGACDLIGFQWREIPRSEVERARLDRSYLDADEIPFADLDAVAVTGAEPTSQALADEPFYPRLAALLAHAERSGLPVLFSCLSAHAAVHALAGVERRSLDRKLSGVFAIQARGISGAEAFRSPHSRWNELPEDRLENAGFEILAAGPECGVDAFRRPGTDQFLFLQGHPEYFADTLLLEYRRDVLRALQRSGAPLPPPPSHYLPPESAQALAALAAGPRTRVAEDELRRRVSALSGLRPDRGWAGWSRAVIGGWIAGLAARRGTAVSP